MSQSGPLASEPSAPPTPHQLPRRYLALGLIIVAICLLGTLVLVRDSTGPSATSTVETFTPASSSLVSSLASVPPSVYDAVGVSSPNPVTPLQPVHMRTAPLWTAASESGTRKPVVFFYGAEFAPYPAAERWALVLALSRFGTFGQLGVMQSSATTAFADVATFTFWQVAYRSHYLSFQSVERYGSLNPTGARYLSLETPTSRQAVAVATTGDGATSFAALNVANRYALTGSAFSPGVLAGLSQDQIAGDLTTPSNPVTQAIVTAANEITASICAVDGDKPEAVCESRGVTAANSLLKVPPAT